MPDFFDFSFLADSFEPGLKLLAALALGILLGAERTIAHKTDVLRTFGLVSMGACLFIVASTTLDDIVNAEIMRVVAGVITGIGFLGAGIIIFRENTIINLTTAAGLWIAVGIGISVGFELYGIAITATVLTLIVFSVFRWLEEQVRDFAEEIEHTPEKNL